MPCGSSWGFPRRRSRLPNLRPLRALPFPDSLITALKHLGWTAAALPVGAYATVEQAVPTVAMGTSLGFHASMSEDIVYAITRVICDHAERVRRIHPAAQDFDPRMAHLQSQGPLHPGAARSSVRKGESPHSWRRASAASDTYKASFCQDVAGKLRMGVSLGWTLFR